MGQRRKLYIPGTSTIMAAAALLLVTACVVPIALAQEPAATTGPVIRIEEDWVLDVREPSYDETAPQITNTISPTTNLDGKFGLFEINHGTQPDYRDGGLELQIWDADTRVNYRRHSSTNRLSNSNETIRYTVAMSINNDNENGNKKLQFEVKNGTSQTWGTFGDEASMKCAITTHRVDLSEYSPEFSVDNSKVGYASFRVRKYALVAVRYYDSNGLIQTDSTERIAHEYNNNVSITE